MRTLENKAVTLERMLSEAGRAEEVLDTSGSRLRYACNQYMLITDWGIPYDY